ncbi:hypothetical protein BU25DRAFT_408581 [Macroventuria anomochaeta]|uniref:Uncharacterized protein n=1 Tax=Macroventuria anomochaeta TaxID=301207 RepID=A0ACB6S6T5_9PLEO|nr:uncharacterized protein BU25DRAFT_408581 [Macroventuria anomochaeta]KAF2629991.1 hypothetical protein BU25DRAFT_408581 [Macroventuria anomochaeta]
MPPMQLAHPSPKRKRDQPQQTPLLNTALAIRPAQTPPRRDDSPAPSSGADSPRNAVADQLRGMTLVATAAIPMSPLTPTDDVIRKKPKLGAMDVDEAAPGTHTAETNAKPRKKVNILDTAAFEPTLDVSREIPETPQAPRPRIVTDIAAFAQPTTFVSSSGSTSSPQTSFSSQNSQASILTDRSSSKSRPRKMPASPPLSALTWQDDEITGHLTGPANDPDDDGTGLNGIGFKPTPAIAYHRAQRRKQQLSEWKTRETREARAKRSQRRHRGASARPHASRESTVEREMPAQAVEVPRRKVQFAV